MNQTTIPPLPYDPNALPRETARHYIPATDEDIQAMLGTLGLSRLDELFVSEPVGLDVIPEVPLVIDLQVGWYFRREGAGVA